MLVVFLGGRWGVFEFLPASRSCRIFGRVGRSRGAQPRASSPPVISVLGASFGEDDGVTLVEDGG